MCLLGYCNSLGPSCINSLIFNVIIKMSQVGHHKNTFQGSLSQSVERRSCTPQVDKLNVHMERVGDLGCNEEMEPLY